MNKVLSNLEKDDYKNLIVCLNIHNDSKRLPPFPKLDRIGNEIYT